MIKPFTLQLFFFSLLFLLINACNTGKLVGVPDPGEDTFDKTRIVVLLIDQATPEMLVAAFEKYGLEKEGPANRTLNEWIFTWVAKIAPELVLEDIRSSRLVKRADFVRLKPENN